MAGPAQPNRSLIDGLEVLLAAIDAGAPIGVRGLARRLGLETTRTQRLLATLAHLGLLHQDGERRYAPGPGLPVLSALALSGHGLLPRAVPAMDALAQSHRVTVALGALWRDRVTYLAVTGPERSLAEAVGGSPTRAMGHSSIGIALLAERGPDYAREYGLDSHWPAAALAREQGFARVDQTTDPAEPRAAIGVLLPASGMAILAIGCAGLPAQVDQPELLAAARALAATLT